MQMIQLASYPNFNCNCQNQISIPAIIASTVESPNFGIKDTWDQYKFKWFVPCIEIVLFKRFQSHYMIGGIKFGDLVLSIVERYLIQCPFLGGSYLRDSNVYTTS